MKKSTLILATICIAIASCNNRPTVKEVAIEKNPINYMVLLDLSDRLITEGQVDRDIEIIKTVFSEFSKTVRQNLVINSREKFQVIIAPQKGIPYNTEEFENALFLDMGSISPGIKVNELIRFENSLSEILNKLYSKAYLGNKASYYPGSGIWQFFNESLESLTEGSYENNLIVISDGYFDLEDYTRQLPEGKRYPTTSFLATVRNNANWKSTLENHDMGLLPVKKEFNHLKVFVAEINPKYEFQYEVDMLIYVWKKWCAEMQIPVSDVLMKTSLPQTVNLLRTKISSSS